MCAEVHLPGVTGFFGDNVHADRLIRASSGIAFADKGKTVVAGDEASWTTRVHRVHHDGTVIHRDVVIVGDDESDLAGLIKFHLMRARMGTKR